MNLPCWETRDPVDWRRLYPPAVFQQARDNGWVNADGRVVPRHIGAFYKAILRPDSVFRNVPCSGVALDASQPALASLSLSSTPLPTDPCLLRRYLGINCMNNGLHLTNHVGVFFNGILMFHVLRLMRSTPTTGAFSGRALREALLIPAVETREEVQHCINNVSKLTIQLPASKWWPSYPLYLFGDLLLQCLTCAELVWTATEIKTSLEDVALAAETAPKLSNAIDALCATKSGAELYISPGHTLAAFCNRLHIMLQAIYVDHFCNTPQLYAKLQLHDQKLSFLVNVHVLYDLARRNTNPSNRTRVETTCKTLSSRHEVHLK